MVDIRVEDLTEPEQRLLEGFRRSDVVDLRGDHDRGSADSGAEDAAMWGNRGVVRAEVIAALVTGSGIDDAGPVLALRLAGARVTGALDLAFADIEHPMGFEQCVFDSEIRLAEASARSVRFRGCVVPRLDASRMQVRGELQAQGCRFGSLSLYAARIAEVNLNGSRILCPGGIALQGELLAIEGAMYCHDTQIQGELRLRGAHVSGYLEADGARLDHEGHTALHAAGLRVDNGMFCRRGHTEKRNAFTVNGGVCLDGARITGGLVLDGARLSHPGGVSLAADHIDVEGGVSLQDVATQGEIRLRSAHITGLFTLGAARLSAPDGMALDGESVVIDGDMLCHNGFVAHGQMKLRAGRVSGALVFDGATLSNPSEYTLEAAWLTVGNAVSCRRGFTSHGEFGLFGARIGSRVYLQDAVLRSGSTGLSVEFERMSTPALYLLPREPPDGLVDLNHAQVGTFRDDPATWPAALDLRGFSYDTIDNDQASVRTRIRWLTRQSGGYAPQLYDQLVDSYHRAGHEDAARRVAIAKQWRRRTALNPAGKLLNWLLYVTVGYGYRTWLAAIWLVGLTVLGSWVFADAYPRHMAPTDASSPAFHPIVYTLDVLLPIVDLNQQQAWAPSGAVQYWSWGLMSTGWILTTVVAAGLTGFLKRR